MDFEGLFNSADLFDERLSHQPPMPPAPESVYKYIHIKSDAILENWIKRPTIKFAMKSELNDPFELTKRWNDFNIPINESKFLELATRTIIHATSDVSGFMKFAKEQELLKGTNVKPTKLRSALMTPGGQDYIHLLRENLLDNLALKISFFFQAFKGVEPQIFEKLIESIGIASFTETPTNRAMWSLYASNGEGFVIEFDSGRISNGRGTNSPQLAKVQYRDDRFASFWDNPYSLTFVKNSDYSFEREWRIVEKISNLENLSLDKHFDIYVRSLKPGEIKSIIIGYNSTRDREKAIFEINRFDAKIKIYRANINTDKGVIEFSEA